MQGDLVVESSGLTEFWDTFDIEEEFSEANLPETKPFRDISTQTEQGLPDQPSQLHSAILWLLMAGILLGWGLCICIFSQSSWTAAAVLLMAALSALAPVVEVHTDMPWDQLPPYLDAILLSAQAARGWTVMTAIKGVRIAVAFMHLGCKWAAAAVAGAFVSMLAAGPLLMQFIHEAISTITTVSQAYYLQGKTAGNRVISAGQALPKAFQQAFVLTLDYSHSTAARSAAAMRAVSAAYKANISTEPKGEMQEDSCTTLCLWFIAGALFPMWVWDSIVSTVVPICAVMIAYIFLTAAAVVALSQPFSFHQVMH